MVLGKYGFSGFIRKLATILDKEKMIFKSILPIIFLAIVISSCIETINYITPVDFEKYEKEYIPGLTQEGSKEIQTRQWAEVLEKTIGKELPDLIIVNKANVEIELKKIMSIGKDK